MAGRQSNQGNQQGHGAHGNQHGNAGQANHNGHGGQGNNQFARHHNNNHNHGGWNGRHHNRYNHWHRGFWPIGLFGYRPWWGGYGWGGGWGSYIGFGLGYGYGGWGYPYGYGGYGGNWGYSPWGYGDYGYGGGFASYHNPYCGAPLVLGSTIIDYSQPLALAAPQYAQSDSSQGDSLLENDNDPLTIAAMADFDGARSAFQNRDYDAALAGVHKALAQLPDDAVLHEFRALVLFAQGNYKEAAATVNSVLAGGPGWDWPTLRGLYSNADTYTAQLRALENYARSHPDSADARFLLGYHYMTCGYEEAALTQFQKVLVLQPDDSVARQIVQSASSTENAAEIPLSVPEAAGVQQRGAREPAASIDGLLVPPEVPARDAAPADGAGAPRLPAPVERTAAKPTIETLAGTWTAEREDGSRFALSLTREGAFTWEFTGKEQSNSLKGTYTIANSLLVLEPESGDPMVGRVTDNGPEGFRFRMLGAPKEDLGLMFAK